MRMRCHFSIIFESLWQFWAVVLLLLFQQIDIIIDLVEDIGEDGIRIAMESGGLWGLLALVVLTLLVLGFQFLRWRKTWITLEDNLIIVERNTLRKVRNTIAIENLSAINMERNLFERIVGTYRIKMDTGSLTTANKTDISIVFAEDKATLFRQAVLRKMAALKGQATEEAVSCERRPDEVIEEKRKEGQPVFHYTAGNMAAHCFYSLSLFNLLVVIAGVGVFVWYVSRFGIVSFVREALGGFLVMILMVLGAAWDLVRRFITYYNFTVYRDGADLHLHYGLLKIRSYTIPVDKITCMEIEQPVMSRLFGRYQAKVITVGVGDEKGESANLTMALPKRQFIAQLSALLPEYQIGGLAAEAGTAAEDAAAAISEGAAALAAASEEAASDSVPEKSVLEKSVLEELEKEHAGSNVIRMAKMIKWVILIAAAANTLILAAELPVKWVLPGAAALAALIGLMYILAHRTAGFRLEPEMAVFANGVFCRRIHLCRYCKMQNISLSAHPLGRRYRMVTGAVHLLNQAVGIPYITEETAGQIGDRMIANRWKK